jgi:hypothetical protein
MSKQGFDGSVTDMRSEYDFGGGMRGKHAAALRREGYTIREYNADGTFTETCVLGEETATPALNGLRKPCGDCSEPKRSKTHEF